MRGAIAERGAGGKLVLIVDNIRKS
jgi:addiction module HigA family antidote